MQRCEVEHDERIMLGVDSEKVAYAVGLVGVLDDVSFEASPAPPDIVKRIKGWCAEPQPRGLCLYGPARSGKTSLAACVARERVNCGDDAPRHDLQQLDGAWTAWHLLASDRTPCDDVWKREFSDARALGGFAPVQLLASTELEAILRHATRLYRYDAALFALEEKVETLVIDDIDVGQPTPWREQVLHYLFERVNRGRKLVVTMNRVPERAPNLTDRLIARLNDRKMFLTLAVEHR